MRSAAHLRVLLPALLLFGCSESHTVEAPEADAGPAARADAGGHDRTGDGGTPVPTDAGPEWTVPPERVPSQVLCHDPDNPTLLIDVDLSGDDDFECAIASDALVLSIVGWRGAARTYVVGEETPDGTAGAFWEERSAALEGTITIEPFETYPGPISWNLSMVGEGRTTLERCGGFESIPPCMP